MEEDEQAPTWKVTAFSLLILAAVVALVVVARCGKELDVHEAVVTSASAPLPISSASAAVKPANDDVGNTMEEPPGFQMYKSKDNMCLVLRSQEWAKKTKDRWGLPYPHHMAIWHKGDVLEGSDCGFFGGIQKGSGAEEQAFYRIAFCMDDQGDREPRRLALTEDKDRLHLMLTFPKNDAGRVPLALNYGWFVKVVSCGEVGK